MSAVEEGRFPQNTRLQARPGQQGVLQFENCVKTACKVSGGFQSEEARGQESLLAQK
jgi:hypothetical protein